MKKAIITLGLTIGLFLGIVVFPFKSTKAASTCRPAAVKTYSDSGYSQATREFTPGGMIYIRVETKGGGEDQKIVKMIDHNSQEVRRALFNQEGEGPYIYTASMLVPTEPGTYYLDVQIRGPGSAFASQKNINVGSASDSSSSVVAYARAESSTGGSGESFESSTTVVNSNSVLPDTDSDNSGDAVGINEASVVSITPPPLFKISPSAQSRSISTTPSFWQSAKLMVDYLLSKLSSFF